MSALMAMMIALIAVLLSAVTVLTYRLWKLRQGGTAAILRDIPAVGGHGWRHGVIRYRGGEAGFYRLSSLRWWPDRRLSRRGIEIVSRRAPRPGPKLFAAGNVLRVGFKARAADNRGGARLLPRPLWPERGGSGGAAARAQKDRLSHGIVDSRSAGGPQHQ